MRCVCVAYVGALAVIVAAFVTYLEREPPWQSPTTGQVSSPYGWRDHPITGTRLLHEGLDITNACETPVFAAADGKVRFAGPGPYEGRTGNQVVIDHADRVTTRYGHLLTGTMRVQQGDRVSAGSQIAQMGGDDVRDPEGAGESTGCHLHFEVNLNGQTTDPVTYLGNFGVVVPTPP